MKEVITIQETHKTFKLQSVLSIMLVIAGFIALLAFVDASPLVSLITLLSIFGGMVWHIVNRVRIWWNHK